MNEPMLKVQRRRIKLQADIAAQRLQLAKIGEQWQTPVGFVDQGLSMLRLLRSHPLLLAAVTGLVVIRRQGAFGLIKAGWRLWKGYRLWLKLSGKLIPKPD